VTIAIVLIAFAAVAVAAFVLVGASVRQQSNPDFNLLLGNRQGTSGRLGKTITQSTR